MRAIVISEHGGPEVLQLVERPDPTPAAGEVIVKVAAGAVNRLDIWVRENAGHAYKARLPLVPGYDVAGEVGAVGPGVTTLAEGDRVFVHCDFACGRCEFCLEGDEAACAEYGVLGVDHDGGYAEYSREAACLRPHRRRTSASGLSKPGSSTRSTTRAPAGERRSES